MHDDYLDGIVSESTDNLLVVILQAVDSLAVLTVTLDSRKRLSAISPVFLHYLWQGQRGEVLQHIYAHVKYIIIVCTRVQTQQ